MELVEGEPLSRLLAREGALPVAEALRIVGLTALALAGSPRGRGDPSRHQAGQPDHRRRRRGAARSRSPTSASPVPETPRRSPVPAWSWAPPTTSRRSRPGPAPSPPRATSTPSGVVGYEVLTGRRPFEGATAYAIAAAHAHEPPPPLPETVPPAVRDLIGRALAKNPADRPASAGELRPGGAGARAGSPYPAAAATSRCDRLLPLPTAVLPAVVDDRLARPRRRRLRLWLIVVAAALVGRRRSSRAHRDRRGQSRRSERGCQPVGGAERRYQTGHQATTTRSRPRLICRFCTTAAGTVTGMHPGRPACGHDDEMGSRGGDGG